MAPGTIPEEEGLLGVEGIAALLNWTFVVSPSLGSEAASASWWYTSGVGFEWDDRKNESNIQKHGLDFADTHQIFAAPMLVASDELHEFGEERSIGIGLLEGRVVVVVFSEPEAHTV